MLMKKVSRNDIPFLKDNRSYSTSRDHNQPNIFHAKVIKIFKITHMRDACLYLILRPSVPRVEKFRNRLRLSEYRFRNTSLLER